jgi:hypothetical protein
MTQSMLLQKADAIVSKRKTAKIIRYSAYGILFLLILWSIQSTVIKDTEWDRIGTLLSWLSL